MTILCERQPRAFNAGLLPARRQRWGQDNDTSRKSWAEAQGWEPMDPIRCRAPDESRAHGGEVK